MGSHPDSNASFLQTATAIFDSLRANGQLFWEPSRPEHVSHNSFKFEFRIIPAFTAKPLPPRGANRPAQNKDPFTNPEDGFVVLASSQLPNATHVLQFNKFCVYRPQFILHTAEFAKQTEDLDMADFAAGLQVLERLGGRGTRNGEGRLGAVLQLRTPRGSSQGHKHFQVVPKPGPEEFILFPDRVVEGKPAARQPSRPPPELHVPYDCLVVRIDRKATADDVYAIYEAMLIELRKATRVMSGERVSGAHNMIMTLDWMCIIPRESRGEDGIYTNAMGMLGLVWVKDRAEREGWNKLHLTDELRAMGSPPPKILKSWAQ